MKELLHIPRHITDLNKIIFACINCDQTQLLYSQPGNMTNAKVFISINTQKVIHVYYKYITLL